MIFIVRSNEVSPLSSPQLKAAEHGELMLNTDTSSNYTGTSSMSPACESNKVISYFKMLMGQVHKYRLCAKYWHVQAGLVVLTFCRCWKHFTYSTAEDLTRDSFSATCLASGYALTSVYKV